LTFLATQHFIGSENESVYSLSTAQPTASTIETPPSFLPTEDEADSEDERQSAILEDVYSRENIWENYRTFKGTNTHNFPPSYPLQRKKFLAGSNEN
jgi:hypothetical protein